MTEIRDRKIEKFLLILVDARARDRFLIIVFLGIDIRNPKSLNPLSFVDPGILKNARFYKGFAQNDPDFSRRASRARSEILRHSYSDVITNDTRRLKWIQPKWFL